MSESHIRARRALLDIIREFKPEGISDLDAALNVISNHARIIQEQGREISRLKKIITDAYSAMGIPPP